MLQKGVFLVLSMVSRVIFVQVLNASYLGINGLFSNVLNILSMADLGIGTAMMYSLFKPLAERDAEKLSALVSFFRKVYLIIAMSVLALGLAGTPFLHLMVNLEKPIPYLEAYYILSLLNVVMSYLFVYRTVLVQADQKSYILDSCATVFRVITFAAQIAVLFLFKNYFVYLSVAVTTGFVSNLVQNAVALKMYPYLRETAPKLERSEKQRIARDIKATFIYRICGTIQSNTDNILISIMVGTVFVGYYSNYSMIVNEIVSIISMVYAAFKAGVGNLFANDAPEEQSFFLYRALELLNFWLVGFSSVCFVCLFQDFIKIAFANRNGMEYVLPTPVMIILVINFYVANIRQTMWMFRETTGLFHEVRYIPMVTAVLNLFLSLLLGRCYGMFGIILATVVARMLYAWWREPMILFRQCFHRSPKTYYITYIKRICLCAAVCGVTYLICGQISEENEYLHFIIEMLLCCVIPNGIFYFCYHKTPEYRYLYEKTVLPIIRKVFGKYTCK